MLLWIRERYPYLLPAIPSGVAYAASRSRQASVCSLWPNPVITIEAILVAFVITSLAMLLSAPKDSYISKFATHPGISQRLMSLHIETFAQGGTACLFSLLVMVACRDINHPYKLWLFTAWIYSLGASTLLAYRIVRVMRSILIR